jgi:hypothetical protein
MLVYSSVQHSLSQPDVSQVSGIHQQAQEQKIKRAHLLAVSQELAKQVTLKSRQAAGMCRRSYSDGFSLSIWEHIA